jgi:phosphoribosylformylglycinamidine synthase
MLYLQGPEIFTPYRLNVLLTELQSYFPEITCLSARYGYFIEAHEALTEAELASLEALLPNSHFADLPEFNNGLQVWVTPRVGTLSPWSSKATDIAHICELRTVERLERVVCYQFPGLACDADIAAILGKHLHDPMTESLILENNKLDALFSHPAPKPLGHVRVLEDGYSALAEANFRLGLALSDHDINYLNEAYHRLERNPTDVELMMFAQVNSEHCRHKIFNASWEVDGIEKDYSLFDMIRHTHKTHPDAVLVAYKDNAAVAKSHQAKRLIPSSESRSYEVIEENTPFVLKVETHNHPTAISPFSGAATGSGGEIRDEAATGRGGYSKAGLVGFSVSNLHIPDFPQPWETCVGRPKHMASALDIMLQGPIGAAAFNNEFGRPNVCGYFRTLQMLLISDYGDICRGYHKPIMLVGGLGAIRHQHVEKEPIPVDGPIVVLGGPGMAIGLGGGAASSRGATSEATDIDFASVQRANPEMQRRAQEVITACCNMGEQTPILSIHDVGAGGLSNAIPEIVKDADLGGKFFLRNIPTAEQGMSPLAIWCNESQERYVLALKPESIQLFTEIAERERCPFAIVGEATKQKQLLVDDRHFGEHSVDMPMSVLFDDPERMKKKDAHAAPLNKPFDTTHISIQDAAKRVLQSPCVGDKSFLITIGDRSVGGLIARDQMVGPWQVPVSDVAVTASDFFGTQGEAMAMGERAPIALLHPAASARMAVGEAVTNIAAAAINDISDIVMSANWMAAADYPGEGAGLYDAVQAVGLELCPALGISIPVGKDSLSMRTTWQDKEQSYSVTSPLSLVITAAAKVSDIRKTLTPELKTNGDETKLILIDLGKGANLLGGSVLAQVYNQLGRRPPDVDSPKALKNFFKAIQSLNENNYLLAYHDRSDGGLFALICEMMFAGNTGVNLNLDSLGDDSLSALFSEELGGVIQVKTSDLETVKNILEGHDLEAVSHVVGELNTEDMLTISHQSNTIYQNDRITLRRWWSETSYRLQALRDNADCAKQQYDQLLDESDPGLNVKVSFDTEANISAPYINAGVRPRIAILREQGVNGHNEMAAAFYQAGFDSVDVHMTDIIDAGLPLNDFKGLVACGGFSYGDVLGAGRGWAQSILMHKAVREEFATFFERADTFTLGVCNGCQMLSQLQSLIPGANAWPLFERNESEQFEARLALVNIPESPSILLRGMAGSVLPIVVSHGEGYANFPSDELRTKAQQDNHVALRYVDNVHRVTEVYPANPNGSPQGITGLTTQDGRATIMMPHPERIFRTTQMSWHPDEWGEYSAWMRMFRNARKWVG